MQDLRDYPLHFRRVFPLENRMFLRYNGVMLSRLLISFSWAVALSAVPLVAAASEPAALRPKWEAAAVEYSVPQNSVRTQINTVPLIQSLGEETSLEIEGGANIFIKYFNNSIDWVLNIAVGIATLWVLIAGGQMMMSGGGGQKDQAKERMIYAIIGLLGLIFVGVILKLLNAQFFV